MRCLFIELRETEIDQLIRRKLLAPDSRNDLGAPRKALYDFFDDTPAVTRNTANAACM
jgi:hypothetical protein